MYSSNQYSVTGNLSITAGTESTVSDPFKINPVYESYKNIAGNIRYDGYSTIHYTLGGASYSATLTTNEKNILSEIQQELDIAKSFESGTEHPEELLKTSSQASTSEIEIPLEAMTDYEIKKWLKEQGYKVKELGNRRFEIVYKYKEDTPSKMMSITSIFDANTGKMEPSFTAFKDGKAIASHATKEDGKSKILTQR